ncbi:MAG: alpha/beta hydrolase [Cyanobacteria bacterium P01_F01_bin.56]
MSVISHGFVNLPGYNGVPLQADLPGECLNWQSYGKALAVLLKNSAVAPVGLVGNSMGAMIAIHAALFDHFLVDHLVLYKVPTFGCVRSNIRKKFLHVSKSIKGRKEFYEFIDDIQGKVSSDVLENLKMVGWENARKMYLGAAVSDLSSNELENLTMPVYFLRSSESEDAVHPPIACEHLFELISNSQDKRMIKLDDVQEINL